MGRIFASALAWILLRLSWLLLRILFFIRVEGVHHIPQRGAVLVVSNHPTYLDPATISCIFLRLAHRPIAFMAWDKLFRIPVIGTILSLFGAFPVNIERPGRKPWEHLLATLGRGRVAGIFPEGERSQGERMEQFKRGAMEAAGCQGR